MAKRGAAEAGLEPGDGVDAKLSAAEAAVYDRQLRVWGVDTQQRIGRARVLVAGSSGLAAEALKNVTLAGCGTVHVMDDAPATNCAAGNFLVPAGAKGTAAEAAAETLAEMNPFGRVAAVAGPLAEKDGAFFGEYDLVLVANEPLATQKAVAKACRAAGVALVACGSRGFCAHFFCDLGPSFTYKPVAKKAEAGDEEPPPPEPVTLAYAPLETALAAPWSCLPRRASKLVPVLQAAAVLEERLGRAVEAADLPALREVVAKMAADQGAKPSVVPPDEYLAAYVATPHEVPPVNAVVGGVLGDCMLKAVTGKGAPVHNWFCFDTISSAGFVHAVGC